MNLIPNEPKKTGNYYCTWDMQAIVSQSNEYKKLGQKMVETSNHIRKNLGENLR